MCFSSNDLKFLYVGLLHMWRPWGKLQEWMFICFIWRKYEKKYMFKPWIHKTKFDEHGGIYNLWHVLLKFDVIVTLETKVESLLPTTIYKYIICWSCTNKLNLITYLIITIWHNLIVMCKFLVQRNISEFTMSMATCSCSLCLRSEFTNLQHEFVSISCKCEWNLYWAEPHFLLVNLSNWLTNHLYTFIPKLPCQSLKL